MTFGAACVDGAVRFRLWAPAQQVVQLVLQDERGERELPMHGPEAGWFELVTTQAGAGSRYGFRLESGLCVPDPASRYQPEDVHGRSEVIDPLAYAWQHPDWTGRPWPEAVFYELHVGSFTPEGSFQAVTDKLEHLVKLGVTAIELMPVADFPGKRNWGYDGVLPYAPDSVYGRPEDLKALVDAAHGRGLMVFLDVVYNHFGPDGNYLHCYAPQFFTPRHQTPWGAAINFDGPQSRTVRDFFIQNALYWIEEYQFDGLRLDAVHAIVDDTQPDILSELARQVADGPGRTRQVHLVLENDRNEARYLRRDPSGHRPAYAAQWNDDIHHVLHVLTTGEADGYYADFADLPSQRLARGLAEGFCYQGEASRYRHGERRGEPSAHLPPTAFINFLQTHDQVGNRALGERIHLLAAPAAVQAATAIVLLAPQIPFLFMGQEWGCRNAFPFFCDFQGELATAVTSGRRQEFARFPAFQDAGRRAYIPDPNDPQTFRSAVLDWSDLQRREHVKWLILHRDLLALRQREIVPRLTGMSGGQAEILSTAGQALGVIWTLGDGSRLTLLANPFNQARIASQAARGRLLYATATPQDGVLAPWGVCWFLETGA